MKILITLFAVALSITAFAQKPVYQFSFDDTDNITFVGERNIMIFPASKRVKPMPESNLQKKGKKEKGSPIIGSGQTQNTLP